MNVDTAVENFLSNPDLFSNFTQVLDEVWEADCTAKKATKEKDRIHFPATITTSSETSTVSTEKPTTSTEVTTISSETTTTTSTETTAVVTTLSTPPHHPGALADDVHNENFVESENCNLENTDHTGNDHCSSDDIEEVPVCLQFSSVTTEHDSNGPQTKPQLENYSNFPQSTEASLTFVKEKNKESSTSDESRDDDTTIEDVSMSVDVVGEERKFQRSDFAIRVLLPVKDPGFQVGQEELEVSKSETASSNEIRSSTISNLSDCSKTVDPTEALRSLQANSIEAFQVNSTEPVPPNPTETVKLNPSETVQLNPSETVQLNPSETVQFNPTETLQVNQVVEAFPIEAFRQNLVPLSTVMSAVPVFEVGQSIEVRNPLQMNLSTLQPMSPSELSSRSPRFPELAVQHISSLSRPPFSNESKSSFAFQLRPLQPPPMSSLTSSTSTSTSSFPIPSNSIPIRSNSISTTIVPLCSSTPLTRSMSCVNRSEMRLCPFPDLSIVSPNNSLEVTVEGGSNNKTASLNNDLETSQVQNVDLQPLNESFSHPVEDVNKESSSQEGKPFEFE